MGLCNFLLGSKNSFLLFLCCRSERSCFQYFIFGLLGGLTFDGIGCEVVASQSFVSIAFKIDFCYAFWVLTTL